MLDLSQYPRFSVQERDRRWARVRKLMSERNCACIVAPAMPDPDDQANSRYLCQIGGIGASAWVVFPLGGEVTAVVGSENQREFFSRAQDWVSDLRVGPAVVEVPARLNELGLGAERIGFTQYQGSYKNEEGAIPYETMRLLLEAMPRAQIYGENEILDDARLVKSEEEIAFIERATTANEEAIRVMCAAARPGVSQENVWAEMAHALTKQTRSYPQRLSIAANDDGGTTLAMPVPDPIPEGAILNGQITARFHGYCAQSNHTIQVGSGGPSMYPSAMKATISVFQELVDWIRPGHTMGELCERWEKVAAKHDPEPHNGVLVHTNGLGNEFPRLMIGRISEREAQVVLEPGVSFTLKPWLRYLVGHFPRGLIVQFGDPVVVTDSGARRLGERPMEPIIVG